MGSNWLTKHFNWLFYTGFVAGILLSLLYSEHQILTGDQTQMLYKGYLGSLSNLWLSYGNAASALGNVPGSLSAYLIGAPLLLWDSPYAPMALLLLLRIVSFLLFDAVIKQALSAQHRLLFLLLYWLNPWFMFETLLYNPSYLFFCSALHFWSAWHLRQRASFSYTVLHLLAIGIAMQLHYSWPILAVISGLLFIRKEMKINWLGVACALLIIIGSLIPYLMELSHNSDISQNSDPDARARYIGWGGVHVYPVLKSMIYWLRYGSLIFANKLINGAQFHWLTETEWLRLTTVYLWRGVLFTIGAISVWFNFQANRKAWQKIRPLLTRKISLSQSNEQWLLLFAGAALFAVVLSAILAPIVFNYWHLMLAMPFALLPLLIYLPSLLEKTAHKERWLLIAALYLLGVNLVAANDSRKFSWQVSYQTQALEYLQTHRTELEGQTRP